MGMKYIIAYDLGTGGTKASLFDQNGASCAAAFVPCETRYPKADFREQRPQDWWSSVVQSTREMLAKTAVSPNNILALAVSGHSLGVVPIARDGSLLARQVPIWNDARAAAQAERFFQTVNSERWYLTTGNGFPAPLYSIFKIMWYKEHEPQTYAAAKSFIGTKDYINYRMTGVLCTDHSYASGSGVYSLAESRYLEEYIAASGVEGDKLPEIHPSTQIIGTLLPEIAEELGLAAGTQVACGGVDNACMALGAACTGEGESYTSLGTSAWIAVSSSKPVVDVQKRPYVFAHCVPGQYVSATAIFSAGNSFRWVRDTLCADLLQAEQAGKGSSYAAMDREAESAPVGANRLLFNPSLAGGSGLDRSVNIRGGFLGLDLRHTRADMLRATLEGICLNLRLAMDILGGFVKLSDSMLIVGGGGKSKFWRTLFADIYNKTIVETKIGEDAGSLGAAAVAAVGCGLWRDFAPLKAIHTPTDASTPNPANAAKYEQLLPVFARLADMQCDVGDILAGLPQEI